MKLFGYTIERSKSIPLQPLSGRGGWWRTVVSEPYSGAWQANVSVNMDTVLTFSAVYACITLIASDIAKLGIRLVEQDANGIWTPVEVSAFSPVLRRPNRYQNRIQFAEQWQMSRLTHGNTYVLKQRDNRGVVVALYVLDPSRVTPLVAQDGSVYYELKRDDLSGLPEEKVTVPAREMIHDRMNCLYHPLVGISPIYASGAASMQGLNIQNSSSTFFGNGSMPGGILTAPQGISAEQAATLKTNWETNFSGDNAGKVAVLGGDLKYTQLRMTAVDAQLMEQWNWTGITVCSTFKVQPYMISIGPPPPYANIEPLTIQYYTQALQSPIESMELCLDEGLELPKPYGTEVDLSNLFRMDTATKVKAAADAIGSGAMSPNEARFLYLDLGPVEGGDTPYLQEQNYSLAALNRRDSGDPFAAPPTVEPEPVDADDEMDEAASFWGGFHKSQEAYHAGA